MAAVFAAAPLTSAHAAPTNPSSTSADPSGTDAAAKANTDQSSAAVEPNYGIGKIRVGVQIKDGSYVPDGTTTAGTKLKIVESGPNAGESGSVTTECTTVPNTDDPQGETFCDFSASQAALRSRLRAEAKTRGMAAPKVAPGQNTYYTVGPGDTVTITQETVEPNLVIDATPQTFDPCQVPPNSIPLCSPQFADFTDAGLPPTAKDDAATTVSPKSVDIDVLKNDTTLPGEPTTISAVSKPKHGKAVVVTATAQALKPAAARAAAAPATTQTVEYTPAAGFVGTDTFTYTLSTPNGTSTATVTVTVLAPPPTARDDSANTTSGNAVAIDVLANDDPNGGTGLRISAVSDPGHGTAAITNGRITYTPDASFVGTDKFTYTITTSGGTATATVTVTVNGGLSATGANDVGLAIELGTLLIVAGGAVSVAGRRRRPAGRHGA